MEAAQVEIFKDYFVKGLTAEFGTTKRVLQALPDGNQDYRPDPKSKTGLELAWHIAASEVWFLECIARGEFGGNELPMPKSSMTGAEIASWYQDNFDKAIARVKALSPAEAGRPVSFFGIQTLPAVLFLGWANNHSVHHRGQLSTYLRAMGGKVPAIYGGSADEPMKM